MSEFTDRLWRELVREHGAELAHMSHAPAPGGRRMRPRIIAGTTLCVVAIGTALAFVLGAGSSPAFAVDRNADGTVTVTIKRVEGIRGANARLQALGVRARAVPLAAGCAVARQVVEVSPRAETSPVQVLRGSREGPLTMRIDPRKIRRGETLVLPAGPDAGHRRTEVAPKIVRGGLIPPCIGGLRRPPALARPAHGHGGICTGRSGTPNSATGNSGRFTCRFIGPRPPGNSGNSDAGSDNG